jgi:serine/threonine-protein kinase
VLVLALAGMSTWWFTSGRYRTVPNVAGMPTGQAERTLQNNDLNPLVKTEHHNDVEAGTIIRTTPAAGEEMLRGEQVTVYASLGRPKVPEVRAGANEKEVSDLIRKQGLRPDKDDGQNQFSDEVEKGKVITVSPQPGTELKLGERVVIVLSKGAEPKPIPDVRNQTRDDAFQVLTEAGYSPQDGPPEFAGDIEAGRVVRTDPQAGTTVEGDEKTVTVYVSNAVTVPDVGNRSVDEAKAMLEGLGLAVDIQSLGGGGRVIAQNPPANSKVAPGSKVTIWVIP